MGSVSLAYQRVAKSRTSSGIRASRLCSTRTLRVRAGGRLSRRSSSRLTSDITTWLRQAHRGPAANIARRRADRQLELTRSHRPLALVPVGESTLLQLQPDLAGLAAVELDPGEGLQLLWRAG